MAYYIGIDAGLEFLAITVLDDTSEKACVLIRGTAAIKKMLKAEGGAEVLDSAARSRRLAFIYDEAIEVIAPFAESSEDVFVGIENHAFDAFPNPRLNELMGVMRLLVHRVTDKPLVEVSTTSLKVYAAGSAKDKGKSGIRLGIYKCLGRDFDSIAGVEDIADSYVVALIVRADRCFVGGTAVAVKPSEYYDMPLSERWRSPHIMPDYQYKALEGLHKPKKKGGKKGVRRVRIEDQLAELEEA